MGVTVTVRKHVDPVKLFKTSDTIATKAALEMGVRLAKEYAAVRYGHLRESIQIINQYAYGVVGSRLALASAPDYGQARDYSGYQEGVWPSSGRNKPFLAPSADDVARAFPGLYRNAIRGQRTV